jgi:5-methylcytosine-specific restriction endonuclease McrA
MAHQVLVLNATYEPINVCSLQRAIVLVLKNKAEVLERAPRRLRSCSRSYPTPNVIRLVYYVRVPRHESRKITRRAVFARDGYVCQYCGSPSRLTMDHLVPRSRGGRSSWDNVVTSCAPCNVRKGDRLPAEVEMFPRNAPRPPGPTIFIAVAAPQRPKSWDAYLGPAQPAPPARAAAA